MSAKRDYYEVLGVSRSADAAEIKRAYRKAAVENHPDRNPDDAAAEERLKEAAEAFEVLSDANKRELYDQYGHEGPKRAGFSGFSHAEDVFAHFGDLFADLAGSFGFGGARRGGGSRGQDLRVQIVLPFTEAVSGVERELTVQRRKSCDTCSGSGAAEGTSPERCGHCGGSGAVTVRQGFFTLQSACPKCRGQGQVIATPCGTCGGTGMQSTEAKLSVKVPPGVDDGQALRVSGAGHAGQRGAPAGNLIVQLQVEPDPRFVRDEYDIHTKVTVSALQATLGALVTVPTLEGDIEIDIGPGTQPGEVISRKGKGIPVLGGRGRGDQHLHVEVEIPRKLDSKHADLLRQIAAERGESVAEKKGFLGSMFGSRKK